jgi:SMODS-associating 2TM, beta-strand rich effector domain
MRDQGYIKAIILTAATIWAVLLWLNHQTIHPDFLTPLSTVMTITVYLALAFDRWLWKLPFLQGWAVKKPVIQGTWKAIIRSSWIDPETGESKPQLIGFMVIRQTLSTLSMRLLTVESSSFLVGTEIICDHDGLYCVSGVYKNEPRLEFRHRSDIHDGALLLTVSKDQNLLKMEGHYWTPKSKADEGLDASDRSHQKEISKFRCGGSPLPKSVASPLLQHVRQAHPQPNPAAEHSPPPKPPSSSGSAPASPSTPPAYSAA